MIQTSTLTASEAREDFYNIVKKASKGLRAYEIKLRGVSPVILIAKEELEGWLETLDIMSSPEESAAIIEGKKEKNTITHDEMKKLLGI
jgi:PHD/YefM family antitoxin component YafN of YafNO toxin-antitoxin module